MSHPKYMTFVAVMHSDMDDHYGLDAGPVMIAEPRDRGRHAVYPTRRITPSRHMASGPGDEWIPPDEWVDLHLSDRRDGPGKTTYRLGDLDDDELRGLMADFAGMIDWPYDPDDWSYRLNHAGGAEL